MPLIAKSAPSVPRSSPGLLLHAIDLQFNLCKNLLVGI